MKLFGGKLNSKGFSMVEAVLVIPILLAMAGLSIDVGRLYTERTQIQNPADEAALNNANKKLEFISTEIISAESFVQPVANEEIESEKDVRVTKPMNKIQAWTNEDTWKTELRILEDDAARSDALLIINEINRMATDVEIIITEGVQGEDCSDEIDNDRDGAVDCRDEDCFTDPACSLSDDG